MRTADVKQELMTVGVTLESGLPTCVQSLFATESDVGSPFVPYHQRRVESSGKRVAGENANAIDGTSMPEELTTHFFFGLENVEAEIEGQYVWIIDDTIRVAGIRKTEHGMSLEVSRASTSRIRNMGIRGPNISAANVQLDLITAAF